MKTILILLLAMPIFSQAQLSKRDSLWLPLTHFIGNWEGNSEGQPGKGTYERGYQFIFGKQFMEVKNKSSYPPTDRKPKGEIHEDIGYISYDRSAKTFICRQFHIEGFVIQYRLQSISVDGKTIVFVSDGIENIQVGWKARETYQIVNENEFTEVFELAEPQKEFEVYSKAVLKRSQK